MQVCGRCQGRLLHPLPGPEECGGPLPQGLLPLPQGQRGQGHHPLSAGHYARVNVDTGSFLLWQMVSVLCTR